MTSAQFSMAIKENRKRLGMSQDQLGKSIGVNFSTISTWERGKRQPRITGALILNVIDTLKALPPADQRYQRPGGGLGGRPKKRLPIFGPQEVRVGWGKPWLFSEKGSVQGL